MKANLWQLLGVRFGLTDEYPMTDFENSLRAVVCAYLAYDITLDGRKN